MKKWSLHRDDAKRCRLTQMSLATIVARSISFREVNPEIHPVTTPKVHRKGVMSSSQALRVRSLIRAAELCGGPNQLAAYLGIRASKLSYMLGGSASVPEEIFLKVVDLLTSREICELMNHNKKGTASPEA